MENLTLRTERGQGVLLCRLNHYVAANDSLGPLIPIALKEDEVEATATERSTPACPRSLTLSPERSRPPVLLVPEPCVTVRRDWFQ